MKAKDLDPKILFDPPILKEGYKYIPRGWGWRSLNKTCYVAYSLKYNLWDSVDYELNCGSCGYETLYYLEIVKDEPMNTQKYPKLQETVEYASSLVGKYIKSRFTNTISTKPVESVCISFDKKDARENFTKKEIFEKYGYCVMLNVKWERASDGYPINPDGLDEKVLDKPVIINGYPAEDKGDYFKFGCANVSKFQLNAILDIMECTYIDCKPLNSVTIGKGVFTKEDIKNLLS